MKWLLLLVAATVSGCGTVAGTGVSSSTPTDFINALAQDKASNCVEASGMGIVVKGARAGDRPGVKVTQSSTGCTIEVLSDK